MANCRNWFSNCGSILWAIISWPMGHGDVEAILFEPPGGHRFGVAILHWHRWPACQMEADSQPKSVGQRCGGRTLTIDIGRSVCVPSIPS